MLTRLTGLVDLTESRHQIKKMLPGGYIHAADLVGAASAMTGSSALGVGVSVGNRVLRAADRCSSLHSL